MNIYDSKILEYGEKASCILQVTRTKKRSTFDKIMDMVLNNFITLLDGLEGNEHLYIVYFPDRVELVEVQSELRMTKWDVTSFVTSAELFSAMDYDGYHYEKSSRLR
jgi:hypothetical protein